MRTSQADRWEQDFESWADYYVNTRVLPNRGSYFDVGFRFVDALRNAAVVMTSEQRARLITFLNARLDDTSGCRDLYPATMLQRLSALSERGFAFLIARQVVDLMEDPNGRVGCRWLAGDRFERQLRAALSLDVDCR